MDKLIYLFELDSVCKTKEEIIRGQNRLFQELVLNGNKVVLSYNQLTDSKAFLSAIENETYYNSILQLFKMGRLKFAPYGKYRTASQYIQDAINRCLAKNDEFIFSCIPINNYKNKEILLRKIEQALKYSDPDILTADIDQLDQEEDKNIIRYIIRYIKMILLLSVEPLARNDVKSVNMISFSLVIQHIINIYQSKKTFIRYDAYSYETLKYLPDSIKLISHIYNLIKNTDSINNRSVWISQIGLLKENYLEPVLAMAEIIINLCYNYTISHNMANIDHNYSTIGDELFIQDFEYNLFYYWGFYRTYGHDFHYKSDSKFKIDNLDLPNWDTAIRIFNKVNGYKNYVHWGHNLLRYFSTAFITTLFYFVLFIAIEYLMNEVQDLFSNLVPNDFISIGFNLMFFTIICSLISNMMKLPDILESLRNFCIGFKDIKVICKSIKEANKRGKDEYFR